MSLPRYSIFNEQYPESLERACTASGCKSIRNDEMLEILAGKFQVDKSLFSKTQLLSESILMNIY